MSRWPAIAVALLVATSLAPAQKLTDAPVDVVLKRTAEYLVDYAKSYASVVAEEHYTQSLRAKRVVTLGSINDGLRTQLKSDVVAISDITQAWINFRDVFEVDGRSVRDRDQRLQKLFLEPKNDPLAKARSITDEGARFNLGTVSRNVNFPTMALTFLAGANQARSKFVRAGDGKVAGVETEILEFEETERPTIVRSGAADLPVAGRFWIEPITGRVMKSAVRFESRDFKGDVTVTFGFVEKLKMWLPVEMADSCAGPRETVTGRATYSNFRRFGVSTDVVIK